ncbi:MAG: hypothetical protein WDO12_04345 [Pseudomonadota bacterium]
MAAGAVMTSHGLRNDDALDLAAAGNVRLPYHLTNPCCLVAATSPHLAARWEGVRIDIGTIKAAFAEIGRQSMSLWSKVLEAGSFPSVMVRPGIRVRR